MQRKLKFRAWNANTNKFVTDDIAIRNDGYYILTYDWHHDGGKSWGSPYDEFIIQQYTGLVDKNGVEIYEGDVVKTIYGYIGHIVFVTMLGAYRISSEKTSIPITTYRFDENQKPVGLIDVVEEVIGNIFKNPELLKNDSN